MAGPSEVILGSKWGSLSPFLQADLFEVDRLTGAPIPGGAIVRGPITDHNIEFTANWQSPFEQSGPENRAPAVMALLQSGAPDSLLQLAQRIPGLGAQDTGIAAGLNRNLRDAVAEAAGRSGMTKINSTQVFTGAAPVKLPLVMHFRAFDNPAREVQDPVNQLAKWTLAKSLSADGFIASAVTGAGVVGRLLPSEAPRTVGLRFGGFYWAPAVIESISVPMTGPRGARGELLHVQVQVQLTTLSALDAGDIDRARGGKPTRMFGNR